MVVVLDPHRWDGPMLVVAANRGLGSALTLAYRNVLGRLSSSLAVPSSHILLLKSKRAITWFPVMALCSSLDSYEFSPSPACHRPQAGAKNRQTKEQAQHGRGRRTARRRSREAGSERS